MMVKTHNTFNSWTGLFTLVITIVTLILLAGCATSGNFGKTERNKDLDNMFLNYEYVSLSNIQSFDLWSEVSCA